MRFNGVDFPILQVSLAIGGNTGTDPNNAVFTLDRDQLNTGQLGGQLAWVDISADCNTVKYARGQGELEDASPGSCTIVIDNTSGAYDPMNPSGPYYGSLDIGIPIWIRAIFNGVTYDRFRGFISELDTDAGMAPTVTITGYDGLEVLGRTSFHTGYPDGQTAGARVAAILDAAEWPSSLRSIETGSYLMAATNMADAPSSALQQLNNVVNSELGLLAVDGSGNVVFYGRLHVYTATRSQVVQAFFDDLADGDTDMTSLVFTRGTDLLFNEARVTRTGGTEQVYDDPSGSQVQYGVRTYSGSAGTWLRTDSDALALASWIVARYRSPQDRVKTLTVEAAPQYDQWSTLLELTYMDRIQVNRTYSASAPQASLSSAIIGISEDISQDSWVFTFTTRNLDYFRPFILDTSHLGFAPRISEGQVV